MNLASFSARFAACAFAGLALNSVAAVAVLTSPTQAESRARRAVALIEERGASSAYALMGSDAALKGADNYVAIIDLKAMTLLAHSGNPALVGSPVRSLMDPGCLEVGRLVVDVGTPVVELEAGEPTMECLSMDVAAHQMRLETAYIERVGDAYLVLGVAGAWDDGDAAGDVSEGW